MVHLSVSSRPSNVARSWDCKTLCPDDFIKCIHDVTVFGQYGPFRQVFIQRLHDEPNVMVTMAIMTGLKDKHHCIVWIRVSGGTEHF